MSNFSPMYFEQPIVIFDTTETLSSTTGAFVLYGGLSVNSTYESSNISRWNWIKNFRGNYYKAQAIN